MTSEFLAHIFAKFVENSALEILESSCFLLHDIRLYIAFSPVKEKLHRCVLLFLAILLNTI